MKRNAQRAILGLIGGLLLWGGPALARRPTVIFDLDDTLIATEQVFQRAGKDFADLARAVGLDPQAARARMVVIDGENAKTMGISSARSSCPRRPAPRTAG